MSRQTGIAAACTILIAGSAVWLIHYYRSAPAAGESIAFLRPAACSACGQGYVATFGAVPATCEKCGAQALWHAVKCGNKECGAIVPVIQDDAAPGGQRACHKCGGTRFQEIGPNDLP